MVPRHGGDTLRRELNAAASSSPDAIGVISWNEFSENTFVEPSRAYGSAALNVIAEVRGATPPDVGNFDSEGSGTGTAAFGISLRHRRARRRMCRPRAFTTFARRRRRPPVGSLGKDPAPPPL